MKENSNNIKVLICTNAFDIVSNGAAKFARVLYDEAEKFDIEVRVLTEDIPKDINNSVYKLNLSISKVLSPFGQFIRMWKYYQKAKQIKKTYNYDILVYNNALVGYISNLFFKPTIGIIHDYSNSSVNLMSVIKGKEKISKRLVFHYVEQFYSNSKNSRLIVNSNYLKNELIRSYNCSERKISVMNMLIENKLIKKSKEINLDNKINNSILFIKSDYKLGGLFDLINALNRFERSIIFTIVGPPLINHQLIKERITNPLIKLSIYDYLPQNRVYELMDKYDVFCVPSHKEAFGLANIEALVHGCKVVSTNVGGIPEAIGDFKNVYLVPPSDSNALFLKIKDIFETGYKGSEEVYIQMQRFSSEEVIKRFKQIIDQNINQKSKG